MSRPLVARLVALVLVAGFAIGCTTPGASSGSGAPVNVQQEITTVSAALDAALATYKTGDKTTADAMVGDAYLEHFEFIEGPLGKVDMAFMENLEDLIRGDIRDAMKAGKPVPEVEALVTEAKTKLTTAATKLQ